MKIIYITFLLLLLSVNCFAGVVFEDNFDSHQPWYTLKAFNQGMTSCTPGVDATYCMPTGWTQWKNDEIWNPYDPVKPRSEALPGMQISDFVHYGASGKSLIIGNEHHNGTGSWGSDTILAKDLGADYPELYFQFKIRYQDNLVWDYPAGGSATIKTFRTAHWDRVSPTMQYSGGPGTNNENAPMFFLDFAQNATKGGFNQNFRCDPQQENYVNYNGISYKVVYTHTSTESNFPPTSNWYATTYNANYAAWQSGTLYRSGNYYCMSNHSPYDWTSLGFTSGNVTSSNIINTVSDNNWHRIDIRIKMNTATDTANGVYQVWQDGNLVYSLTNVKWIDYDGNISIGLNTFMLGGNVFWNYPEYGASPTPVSREISYRAGTGEATTVREHWYAIDDVVVSTTAIPSDYVIGNAATNGVCGGSNGGTFSSTPTDLCGTGTPSSVTGQYNWTCTGSNGGTTANCSASYSPGLSTTTAAPPGDVYTGTQTVTISCIGPCSQVQYCTSGASCTPTTSYTTPVSIAVSGYLRHRGSPTDTVVTDTYTINYAEPSSRLWAIVKAIFR